MLGLGLLEGKTLWGVWRTWDLPSYDGAHYFWLAGRLTKGLAPNWEYSPGYVAVYSLFHLAIPVSQPFAIYAAQRVLTLWVVSVLLFVVLARRFSPLLAWSLAAFSILSRPVLVNEFVVHVFVLIPVLLAFLAAERETAGATALTLGSLAAVYLVRPEFASAFVAATVLLGIDAWRRVHREAVGPLERWIRPGTFLAAAFLSILLLLEARANARDRAWFAFSQHYALTFSRRNPDWVASESEAWGRYRELVTKEFGDARSLGEAVARNPREVLAHVLWNLEEVPAAVGELLVPLVPGHFQTIERRPVLLLLFPVAGLVVTIVKATRLRPRAVEGWTAQDVRITVVAAVISGACLLSNAVISTWSAYLLPLLPLVLCGIAALVEALPWPRVVTAVLAIGVVCLVLASASPYGDIEVHPTRDAVAAMPKWARRDPYRILADAPLRFCAYGDQTRELCGGFGAEEVAAAGGDFGSAMVRENIQFIFVDDALLRGLPTVAQDYVRRIEEGGNAEWRRTGATTTMRFYERVLKGDSSGRGPVAAGSQDTSR